MPTSGTTSIPVFGFGPGTADFIVTFGFEPFPSLPDPTPPTGADDMCLGMPVGMIDSVIHTVLGIEVY